MVLGEEKYTQTARRFELARRSWIICGVRKKEARSSCAQRFSPWSQKREEVRRVVGVVADLKFQYVYAFILYVYAEQK